MQKIVHVSVILVLLLVMTGFSAEIYQYRNTTGNESVVTVMQIELIDSLFRVEYTRGGVKHIVLCESTGNTKHAYFQELARRTEWETRRIQDTLFLSGFMNGCPVTKQFQNDASPWFQFMPFSLQLFSNTNQRVVRFWVIRPEDLKYTTMRATREQAESLKISGDLCVAERIKITLTGFLAKFWHGFYGFRKSDNLFTRYEGRNGPPGSKPTVIELTQEISAK